MNVFKQFFSLKTAPAILLCISTILALIIANSPFRTLYDVFKHVPVVFQVGTFIIDKPLLLWINDGLMVIFFLLIGLEIKREIFEGHLSTRHAAILPVIAALGGVLMPAILYSYINWGNATTLQGWAIPAATDIAFSLGVLTAFGDRVPRSLKICLATIAVLDDLVAIVIIALFYTADISMLSLMLAFIGLGIAILMNAFNVTKLGPYVIVGLFMWACLLKSGVHATLAGVALGLTIPLKSYNEEGQIPLHVMEHTLQPFVSFVIIPLFAFANAGISFQGLSLDTLKHPITLGVIIGLFVGKQLGVMLFSFIGYQLKICRLPNGITWLQFYSMAILTGIGFTMSLFIGTLAFTDIALTQSVRLGVLLGSLLSVLLGAVVLRLATRNR